MVRCCSYLSEFWSRYYGSLNDVEDQLCIYKLDVYFVYEGFAILCTYARLVKYFKVAEQCLHCLNTQIE